MDWNFGKLPDGTQIRFLDMPAIEHKPMTAEQQAEYDELIPKLREMSKRCTLSAHRIVNSERVGRMTLCMPRYLMNQMRTIAKEKR